MEGSKLNLARGLSRDVEIAKTAQTLLIKARVRLDSWADGLFNAKTLADQRIEIRDTYFDYLETIVDASDRDRIAAMLDAGAPTERTNALLMMARVDNEPGAVLAELAATPGDPSDRLLTKLAARIGSIDSTVLKAAFSSRHEAIRIAIARELVRRNEFNDIRAAAQGDSSETVRIIEYRHRLRSAIVAGEERPPVPENVSYTLANALRLERLDGLGFEELQQRIKWFDLDGPQAYQLSARDHWDRVSERVREDLSDGFKRFQQEGIDETAKAMSEGMAPTIAFEVAKGSDQN